MSNVIITLTTIPPRLHDQGEQGIKLCIESLLKQSYANYEIHFNIPIKYRLTNEDLEVPQWLTDIARTDHRLMLFRVVDVGPSTKLYNTLKRVTNPDDIIIVVDDDLVYHPDMIKEHVINQDEYVNCALGYDGLDVVNGPVFNDVRDHFVVSVPFPVEVKLIQHYKSVSYKRSFFTPEFFTDFYGKTTSDDVLVSCYLKSKGIKKIVMPYSGEPEIHDIETWRDRGGTETFPVLRHTHHEREEGCNDPRSGTRFFIPQEFIDKGYI